MTSNRSWIARIVACALIAAGAGMCAARAPGPIGGKPARLSCALIFRWRGTSRCSSSCNGCNRISSSVCRSRPPPSRSRSICFKSEEGYRSYLLSRYPQAPQRRALFVKSGGPGQVFAYLSPEFEIDLRHETTHALLHASLVGVPLWLDEGLAEYFEVASQDRQRNNPHLRTLKWNLWMGLAPRMSSLEDKHDLAEMGKREYMFAWAWVHYLLHGPVEARQELIDFLRQAQSGPPAESLSQRLERRLPNPEKRLAQHFVRPRQARTGVVSL